jgi:hypothetical protein
MQLSIGSETYSSQKQGTHHPQLLYPSDLLTAGAMLQATSEAVQVLLEGAASRRELADVHATVSCTGRG